MPRLARTVCARVPHHITQRGNRHEDVFFTGENRETYLAWLKDYAGQPAVDLAYCLMINRIHLIAVYSLLEHGYPGRFSYSGGRSPRSHVVCRAGISIEVNYIIMIALTAFNSR